MRLTRGGSTCLLDSAPLRHVTSTLRSVAPRACDANIVLFAASALAQWNDVIELDLVILEHLAAHLTLVLVPPNHAEHHRPRDVTANPTEFFRFRERLVHKEDRAHVSEHRAALLHVRLRVCNRVLSRVELSDLTTQFPVTLGIIRACRQLGREKLVVRDGLGTRG